MHGVAAFKKSNGSRRRKHKLSANWATALEASLHALVLALERDGHTSIARLAMEIIFLVANTAQAALGAMKNIFVRRIIKKATLCAKISCKSFMARLAPISYTLLVTTPHALEPIHVLAL